MNFFQRMQAMLQRGNAALVPYARRCGVAVLRSVFVSFPLWAWNNTVVAAVQNIRDWCTRQVRRHALYITGCCILLLLVATEQYLLLNLLFWFSVAMLLLWLGCRIWYRGIFPKKKK